VLARDPGLMMLAGPRSCGDLQVAGWRSPWAGGRCREMGQRRQRAHRRASSRPTGRRSTSPARAMGTRKHGHGSLTGRAGPPGDRHRGDDGRRREHTRGRLLRGSRVAAGTPADGHHLRRLMPGTGKLCVCSWPCLEPHARQRGDRAVPNLPPRLRRERALDSEDRPRFMRLAMD